MTRPVIAIDMVAAQESDDFFSTLWRVTRCDAMPTMLGVEGITSVNREWDCRTAVALMLAEPSCHHKLWVYSDETFEHPSGLLPRTRCIKVAGQPVTDYLDNQMRERWMAEQAPKWNALFPESVEGEVPAFWTDMHSYATVEEADKILASIDFAKVERRVLGHYLAAADKMLAKTDVVAVAGENIGEGDMVYVGVDNQLYRSDSEEVAARVRTGSVANDGPVWFGWDTARYQKD